MKKYDQNLDYSLPVFIFKNKLVPEECRFLKKATKTSKKSLLFGPFIA